MRITKRFHRMLQRPHCAALSALFALCIGWTLALAHAAQHNPAQVELGSGDASDATQRVRIAAELRVGAPAPAPVADAAAANASLRGLHARVRYAPPQHPLAAHASAAWLIAYALPLRLRVRAQSTSGDGAELAPHRAIARRWPLPRSSCSDSDPDADVARRS